jgi:hypothetical protein
MVECPERRPLTAQQPVFPQTLDNLMHYSGSVVMIPASKEVQVEE